MGYNKIAKRYKIMDATVNKNLINDEISLRLVKQSGPDIPPQPRGMPKWFKEWSETVYQYQPPAWFKHWVDTEFKPFKTWIKTSIDNINTRLDQNGLAILKIEKRLDQNGLKPLIKSSK